jgi:hypothetical protein
VLQFALKEMQGHLATLDVDGPDGAELWIDGERVSRLPARPLRVRAKPLVIELRATGFESARLDLTPEPGRSIHESFVLKPLRAEPVRAEAAIQVAPDRPERTPPPRRDAEPLGRTLGWATAGAAALFAAEGLAATIYQGDRTSQYKASDCTLPAKANDSTCARIGAQFDAARALEFGGFATGAASGFASLAFFLASPPGEGARGSSARPPLAWIAGGGAVLFLAGGLAWTAVASDKASHRDATGLGEAEVLETAAYAGAGMLAVTSAALFLTLPAPSGNGTAARTRAWCLPAGRGLACGFRF